MGRDKEELSNSEFCNLMAWVTDKDYITGQESIRVGMAYMGRERFELDRKYDCDSGVHTFNFPIQMISFKVTDEELEQGVK